VEARAEGERAAEAELFRAVATDFGKGNIS